MAHTQIQTLMPDTFMDSIPTTDLRTQQSNPQINNQEEETCWIISTVVVVIHNPNCYFILLQKMEQNTLFLTAIQVYFFNNTLSLFHRTYIYYCNYFNIVDCVNID